MSFEAGQYGTQRVVVVLPARNEVRTIGDLVARARPFCHEVVVADGHSSDGTPDAARSAGARVLRDPGTGKGGAIRMCIDTIDADVLVFMDADGSHHPEDIPRLVQLVVDGSADIAVGSRFTGGSDELSVNVGQLIRTIGNIAMNIAINRRWKIELTDTLNGFRAVRRAALLRVGLREHRHTIEQEMIMKALRYGFTVRNVATHEYTRAYGTSHINVWKEWPLFLWCMLINLVPRNRRLAEPAAPIATAPPASPNSSA
ncbi:MAG TPA: glycosyltransferase family 2 protein [Gemmatimonadaceae bacterium]|nr:glycosyltransferase family 2 protein [Gemmatimonadaceae bacterium]